MMNDSVFTGINHVCIVTRDLDRAVRLWADKYSIGPWHVYSFDNSNMEVSLEGQPADFGMRVGLCSVGPTTRFEIIQPLDEQSPYAQSLAEKNDADHVHHIRLDVANYDEAVSELKGRDLRPTMDGRFSGAKPGIVSTSTYFDTEDDLGFIVEVAGRPADFPMFEPDYVYPRAERVA